MIGTIIDYSVRHRVTVLLVTFFGCVLGYRCLSTMRLDAIPDLGDTQVIVYSKWDRSPDLVESQVTYPIVTAMLGTPHVKTVRGVSDYGYSYVYVIFEDDVDVYWARSRVLEITSALRSRLPEDVHTELGPDASSLGWVFQYVLKDSSGRHSLADLRALQEWNLAYRLRSVPGVADIATVGGAVRQYQINLDPNLLQRYCVSLSQVTDAVRAGNNESSGRLLEFGGSEYMVRGRGYATSLEDFAQIVVSVDEDGGVIRVRDLGEVVLGPELQRGLADLDGEGNAVSGIVVMRSGENALQVIDRVKAKLRELGPGLPAGVSVVPIYDRSELIERTIGSVKWTIAGVVLAVVLIILLFLWHLPSAIVPLITMPVAILLTFIPMRGLGLSLNVMSLAGVAIAFGELIDASIIIVEQTHKRLERWQEAGSSGSQANVVLDAVKQVAKPTFFALLVIAVSVFPVLALESQEGRMFKPLAYSKSLAMLCAALLVLTLDPALRMLLTRVSHAQPLSSSRIQSFFRALMSGRVRREESHPISGWLIAFYEPVVRWTLQHKAAVLWGTGVLMAVTVPVFFTLGSEYMPPMDEGALLYMPTTAPGMSAAQAKSLLTTTDAVLKQFPEVDHVLGKAGRVNNATDPAPLSMLETLITLKPHAEWRQVDTWYSSWAPEAVKVALRHLTPDTLSTEELVKEMDRALHVPGVANAWTMPIKGRIDMLMSGIRTPVGLKISGTDSQVIEDVGQQVQVLLSSVQGTRVAFAERSNSGNYIDIKWNREQLARYGISMEQAQRSVSGAIGGENVSTVFSGGERYPVDVRYMRDFRGNMHDLGQILVSGGPQVQIPISQLAMLETASGPSMIRDENGSITAYIYVDVYGRDPRSYMNEADKLLRQRLKLPTGYTIAWGGQYEAMQRVDRRLRVVIPATILLVLGLIYWSTRSVFKTSLVMMAVPFSAIGAVWLVYLLHYNVSVAVWVGIIGLLSIDAETGVFMLLYLDMACNEAIAGNCLRNMGELREAVVYGAARRIRPKFMTFATTCIGLCPVMWSMGAGSDVMKRIAAPMIGGIFTSFFLELLVYPLVYEWWRSKPFRVMEKDGRKLSPSRMDTVTLVSGD